MHRASPRTPENMRNNPRLSCAGDRHGGGLNCISHPTGALRTERAEPVVIVLCGAPRCIRATALAARPVTDSGAARMSGPVDPVSRPSWPGRGVALLSSTPSMRSGIAPRSCPRQSLRRTAARRRCRCCSWTRRRGLWRWRPVAGPMPEDP